MGAGITEMQAYLNLCSHAEYSDTKERLRYTLVSCSIEEYKNIAEQCRTQGRKYSNLSLSLS